MTPDVNVLVAAFRADHVHHDTAHGWLNEARQNSAKGSTTLTLLPMIATAFLRLVTNRRVFSEPDSIEDAIAFIDVLLDTPGVVLEDCGKEWPLLRDKLLTQGLHGNLVTDAWIEIPDQYIEGAKEMCSYRSDGEKFLKSLNAKAGFIHRKLDDIILEDTPINHAGCFCTEPMLNQKWRMALTTLRYALAKRDEPAQ